MPSGHTLLGTDSFLRALWLSDTQTVLLIDIYSIFLISTWQFQQYLLDGAIETLDHTIGLGLVGRDQSMVNTILFHPVLKVFLNKFPHHYL